MSSDDSASAASRQLLFDLGSGAPPSRPVVPSLRTNTRGTSDFVSGGGFSENDVVSMLSASSPYDPGHFDPAPESPMFQSAVPAACMIKMTNEVIENFCLGPIGTSGEKCCTHRTKGMEGTCGIKNHSRKANYEPGAVYYWDSIKNVVYLQTMLPATAPLCDAVYEFRFEDLSHVQVKELFELVTSQSTSVDELLVAKDSIIKMRNTLGYTPRKAPRFSPSLGSDSVIEIDAMDAIEELPDHPLAPSGSTLDAHVRRNWPKVLEVIGALQQLAGRNKRSEEEINRLSDDINDLSAAGKRVLSLLGTPIDGNRFDVFKILDGLEGTVGTLASRFEGVATTTESTSRSVHELEIESSQLQVAVNQLTEFKVHVATELRRLQTTPLMSGVMDEVRRLRAPLEVDGTTVTTQQMAETIMRQVIPALTDLWELHERFTVGPSASFRPGERTVPVGQHVLSGIAETQAFATRLATLESKLGVTSTTLPHQVLQGAPLGDIFGAHEPAGARMPRDFDPSGDSSIESRILRLEEKLLDVESRMGEVTVECGGFVFRNLEDCSLFIEEYVPGYTFGFFYDIVSLLQRSWVDQCVSVGGAFDTVYKRKRAGFDNLNEAVITASMTTVLPTCLGEDTGKKSDPGAPLTAIPSHKYWTFAGGQSGRKFEISRGIHGVQNTLSTQIKAHFTGPKGRIGSTFAHELLSRAKSHWIAFEQMIDGFYIHFCDDGPEKEAWSLVCLIGKTVFEVLHDVRSSGADLSDITISDPTDPEYPASQLRQASRVLWASLQAMRVMEEFVKAEFRNHPRVGSVVVLHLFANRVPKDSFDKLHHEFETLHSAFDSLVSQVNAKLPGGVKVSKGGK